MPRILRLEAVSLVPEPVPAVVPGAVDAEEAVLAVASVAGACALASGSGAAG
uniref:hypothetical protein n=1 Tax=Paracoccus sp. T5 TaxID=3402161 RepID=UPI003AE1CA49